MRLKAYLKDRGEKEAPFSRRAGLSQAAVHFIANHAKADPRISTCFKIVRASREQPTPEGATVTWEDLLPQEKVQRKHSAVSRKRKR